MHGILAATVTLVGEQTSLNAAGGTLPCCVLYESKQLPRMAWSWTSANRCQVYLNRVFDNRMHE